MTLTTYRLGCEEGARNRANAINDKFHIRLASLPNFRSLCSAFDCRLWRLSKPEHKRLKCEE